MRPVKLLTTVAGLAFGFSTLVAQTLTTNFVGVNKVIPDGLSTGVSDTHVVDFGNPDFTIANVRVTLNIAGGYNGDLYAYLVHDSGFTVLLNREGRTSFDDIGYGDTGLDVTFDDTASDIHAYRTTSFNLNGSGQLTESWGPDGRNVDPANVRDTDTRTSLLASFNGLNPNGSWTLFLADMDFGEQGTLMNWGLAITPVPEPSAAALLLLGVTVGARVLRQRR